MLLLYAMDKRKHEEIVESFPIVHPRDEHILFVEDIHTYYVRGESGYISVTTFIHHFFEPFDADKVIPAMRASSKWNESNKYFYMTDEEIKEQWKKLGQDGCRRGTKMHKFLEKFFVTAMQGDVDTLSEEDLSVFEDDPVEGVILPQFQFLLFLQEVMPPLKPFRMEWAIYDDDYHIAGMIDALFTFQDERQQKTASGKWRLVMADWKRTPLIRPTNYFQQAKKGTPIESMDNCNYVHYTLQLNLYKFILEKNYNVVITEMFLVCFHPDREVFEKTKIPKLQKVIKSMVEDRRIYDLPRNKDKDIEEELSLLSVI